LLFQNNIIFCQNSIEYKHENKEDYWLLSSHLFSYLIKNDSLVQKKKKYNLTSSFFNTNNDSTNDFLHTGPYETIKFRVELQKKDDIKSLKDTETIYENYIWRVWNCGDEDEKNINFIEIPIQNLIIKYQLINKSKTKRKKTEKYLINYGKSIFLMKIKCSKGFKFYKNKLKKDLFILRVFEKINYYHPKYGCAEILNVSKKLIE